uniref:Uncharacterized protein n=1 Tax=Knipowitschia caucasica TaxID=637954 RepID=A0AAV2K718_KNICA
MRLSSRGVQGGPGRSSGFGASFLGLGPPGTLLVLELWDPSLRPQKSGWRLPDITPGSYIDHKGPIKRGPPLDPARGRVVKIRPVTYPLVLELWDPSLRPQKSGWRLPDITPVSYIDHKGPIKRGPPLDPARGRVVKWRGFDSCPGTMRLSSRGVQGGPGRSSGFGASFLGLGPPGTLLVLELWDPSLRPQKSGWRLPDITPGYRGPARGVVAKVGGLLPWLNTSSDTPLVLEVWDPSWRPPSQVGGLLPWLNTSSDTPLVLEDNPWCTLAAAGPRAFVIILIAWGRFRSFVNGSLGYPPDPLPHLPWRQMRALLHSLLRWRQIVTV